MGIRGRVRSAKTPPSQSKSKQNPEEQGERGTNQEKRRVATGRRKETYKVGTSMTITRGACLRGPLAVFPGPVLGADRSMVPQSW